MSIWFFGRKAPQPLNSRSPKTTRFFVVLENSMWIANTVKKIFKVLGLPSQKEGYAWWVQIETQKPGCTYYFGPFDSSDEARSHQAGYVEDLQGEGAKVSSPTVRWCKPNYLTVCQEENLQF